MGIDGLQENIKTFFVNDLSPILCRLNNYILNSGDPPKSWSEAIITVLHKEGKDPLQCARYHPISLLWADYKILDSSNQDTKLHKEEINSDQTRLISGCQGINNVSRAFNLQSITTSDQQPSMLLSLDAEKAFDSGLVYS